MKTQQLLTTPHLREQAISKDGKAKLIDQQVRGLVGDGASREEIYAISSQIFGSLMESSHGDVGAMAELLQKAKDDPKAFLNGLSGRDRKAIEALAKKVSDKASSRQPSSVPK